MMYKFKTPAAMVVTLAALAALAAIGTTPVFARARASGYAQQGGHTIQVLGYTSSTLTPMQASYPGATVTVFNTGGPSGIVNTSGTVVTWVSGIVFNANGQWSGLAITINSVAYTISSCSTGTSCTLTGSAGTQASVTYSLAATAPAAVFSNNTGTPKANPFTSDSTGYFFFYADNGVYDIQFSGTGAGIATPFTWAAVTVSDPSNQSSQNVGNLTVKTLNNIRFSSQFAGSDCGAQINAAYADIPSTGGMIVVDTSCSFATPVVFGTNGKPATLAGYPAGAVTMTFTASSGTAVTLNYGSQLRTGKGLRDLVLTGPGNGTAAVGVVLGGSNGATGSLIDNATIQSFGTNFQLASNTWISDIRQTMIRDGGTNVLFPSGLTQAGENIRFDHSIFADAPSPHTNSVWIQGGGQEIVFENCSFDQAQLRIGNGGTSAAQIVVHGSHFENPNFATGVDYPFLVMDNNNGNYVRFTDNFIEQDRTSGGAYASFMVLQGGVAHIGGLGIFTPAQLTALAALSNAVNVNLFGYNDLSGQTVALYNGSTTGFLNSFPGANTATSSGFNATMKPGNTTGGLGGGAGLDIAGNLRTANRLVSLVATGTAPLSVNSTTPVQNLFGHLLIYDKTGAQDANSTHEVIGTQNFSSGTYTLTLTGAAVFGGTFVCVANNNNPATTTAVRITQTSGSSITFTGSAGDSFNFDCKGD